MNIEKIKNIYYFKHYLDDYFGKKEYVENIQVINVGEEFEPIIKYIVDYFNTSNIDLNIIDEYNLVLKFIDYIQDNSDMIVGLVKVASKLELDDYITLFEKMVGEKSFPWLDAIEALNYDMIVHNEKIKWLIHKYHDTFNNFDKIHKCAIFWNNKLYTAVYKEMYDIRKKVLEYVNLNKLVGIHNFLGYKQKELNNSYDKHFNDELYSTPINDIVYIQYHEDIEEDEGYIRINNNFELIGVGECYNNVYINLHPEYQDLSQYVGKTVINISMSEECKEYGVVDAYDNYMDKKIYYIIFDDLNIFRFYLVNINNGYYDGHLEIRKI